MNIKICLDVEEFKKKPSSKEASIISKRIAEHETEDTIEKLAIEIGVNGHSWTPATFYDYSRQKSKFKSQQLFALDFDEGISYKKILERAEKYKIPIAFIYETFSSIDANKFRVVFLHCSEIHNDKLAKCIQYIFMNIFKECDPSCKDLSRMYYGGKKLLYYNDNYNDSCFDFSELVLNFVKYLKNKYSHNYKRNIITFSKQTGIVLTEHNFPCINHIDTKSEDLKNVNLEISPIEEISNLDNNYIIIRVISKFSNIYYEIFFHKSKNFCFNNNSSKVIFTHTKGRRKLTQNIDSNTLYDKCQLFKEFYDGSKWLYHNQLFGIATNLINILGGSKIFKNTLISKQNQDYHSYHAKDWDFYLNYIQKQNYQPQRCDHFCPYHEICDHAKNMIETIKVRRNEIIKIGKEKYVSLKAAERSLEKNFISAQNSKDNLIHIIKAQTGLGKSTTYLENLNNSNKPYIIAVPTNKLKQEILEKALLQGYDVIATPSLPEDLDKITKSKINKLYSMGAYRQVKKEIKRMSKEEGMEALQEYLTALDIVYSFKGHIITTHARLLTFSQKFLDRYEIIIDEDILRTLLKIET